MGNKEKKRKRYSVNKTNNETQKNDVTNDNKNYSYKSDNNNAVQSKIKNTSIDNNEFINVNENINAVS